MLRHGEWIPMDNGVSRETDSKRGVVGRGRRVNKMSLKRLRKRKVTEKCKTSWKHVEKIKVIHALYEGNPPINEHGTQFSADATQGQGPAPSRMAKTGGPGTQPCTSLHMVVGSFYLQTFAWCLVYITRNAPKRVPDTTFAGGTSWKEIRSLNKPVWNSKRPHARCIDLSRYVSLHVMLIFYCYLVN